MKIIVVIIFAFSCALQTKAGMTAMQSMKIDNMTIVLDVPARIRDAAVRPYSTERNPKACAVQVIFRNESGGPIKAPLDEIGNGLVMVYNVAGAQEPLIDNEIPPPPNDGSVMMLAPGDAHVVRMSFEYPQPLMPERFREPVRVAFCVRWREEWLRVKNYASGVVEWNHSFEICADVLITPDENKKK